MELGRHPRTLDGPADSAGPRPSPVAGDAFTSLCRNLSARIEAELDELRWTRASGRVPVPRPYRATGIDSVFKLHRQLTARRPYRRHGRPRNTRSCLWSWDTDKTESDSPAGKLELRRRWIKLINSNQPWEWFVTLTFKFDVSERQARRLFRRWAARLRQAARDSNGGRDPRFAVVLATERTTRGRVHFHALAKAGGLLESLSRYRWAARWESVGGACGMARINAAQRGACQYLTKYIAKGGALDAAGYFVGRRHRRGLRVNL